MPRNASLDFTLLVTATSRAASADRRVRVRPWHQPDTVRLPVPAGTGPLAGWPRPRSGACRLRELVGTGAGVDGVQHRQLRVVERPIGEVEGVGGLAFGP